MIEIVTHVYAEALPQYSQMLKWQLASICLHKPEMPVQVTVCYTESDTATTDVLNHFGRQHTPFRLVGMGLDKSHLFRRAIGRNIAAKRTDADVVWFSDVDYLFGQSCLDSVVAQVDPDSGLCCPKRYFIHRDHETGDAALRREWDNWLPEIDAKEFEARKQKIAIGGLQIVGGDTSRRVGYCDGTKWVQPVDPEQGFRSCRCDKAFRRLNKFETRYIRLPQLYRLRHTTDGRDFDGSGQNRGKDVW